MRNCLEYKTPVPAQDRVQQDTLVPAVKAFKRNMPDHLLKAVDWAMALQPKNRPQSVAELQQALVGS
jgi:hypothetical protein